MSPEQEPRKNFLSGAHHGNENWMEGSGILPDEDDFRNFDDDDEEREEREEMMIALSEALGDIFRWLSRGKRGNPDWHLSVARKTIAMIWAMRPDLLDNLSLRELGKEKGVASSVSNLSKHVSTFTKRWGHFHRGTKSDKARKAYSKARRKVVEREKEKDP